MIVRYESIGEHIQGFIDASHREGNRPIRYIALMKSEYEELMEESKARGAPEYSSHEVLGEYMGVTLVGWKYHADQRKQEVSL